MLLNRWATDSCRAAGQLFSRGFLENALPVVADFLGVGSNQILYGKNEATMALLKLDGSVIWETPHFDGMHRQSLQGIGDFDGGGKLDVIAAGHCGTPGQEVRKYDGRSGALLWSIPMPRGCEWPGPKAVAIGDLDGDGRDEALVMNGNVLHAFGENGQGQGIELWRATWDGGWNEYGDPVIADPDGSGRPQILINTPSGYLYGLGSQ